MNRTKPVAIILSSHLDDAVFAMGGFLAKRQYETEVATLFAGKPVKTCILNGIISPDLRIATKKSLQESGRMKRLLGNAAL